MTQPSSKISLFLIVFLLAATMTGLLFIFDSNILLTLIVFGLAIFTGLIAWRPVWGLYGLALCLPLINLNFNISWMIIPLIDALAIICLLGYIIHLVINPQERKALKFPFFTPFLLFWLATIASALISPHVNASLWYSVRWILFFYLAYIWFPVNVIKDKKILKGVLISFVISGLAMAVMGVISIINQDFLYSPFRFTVLTFGGVKPFGLDQNLLVETLLPAIFFLLALGFWFKKRNGPKIIFLTSLFLFIVLIGTFSRAGWIALFICLAIYIFYGKRASLKQVILVTAISLLLLSPFFVQMFKLQTSYNIGVSSNNTRLLLTQISWNNFKDSPWLGKGTGEYVNLVNDNIRFRAQHGEASDSNGVWQKIMAENGLAGLVAFAWLMLYILYNFYRRLKNDRAEFPLLLPICLGALSIFIFEFSNTSYYHGKMWLPIAIAWSAIIITKKNNHEHR